MTVIAIRFAWMRQMKQPLGVPCNGAEGSEGSELCLSLWLSKSFLQLMMRLWGTCCFNGEYCIFHILSLLISFLLLFLLSLFLFVLCSSLCLCVCASFKLSSGTVFSPWGFVDSYPPSYSCRRYWQYLTARAQPLTPYCYEQWASCKQHPLLSVYL